MTKPFTPTFTVPEMPEWLTKSPHRPPNDTVGDVKVETLFAAAGRLTHAWEGVEFALMTLFARTIKDSQNHEPHAALMAAFGAIVGSGARCDMIEAAARSAYHFRSRPDLLELVEKWVSIARRLSALRNIVAHGMALNDDGEKFVALPSPTAEGNYFIIPAIYNTNKTTVEMRPKMIYSSKTLNEIAAAMTKLSSHISGDPDGWQLHLPKPDGPPLA